MSSLTADELRRVAITTAVRDTDAIPKVAGAGDVVQRDGRSVQVMHNGVLVEEGCYYGDWMTEVIRRLRGHHEPQEERVFHALVQRLREAPQPQAMVELGSFWAYYSIWAHKAVPSLRTILVEPDPAYLEVGRRNFALNAMTGDFRRAAVGIRHGATVPFACESDGEWRDTPTLTVDGLMRDAGLSRIDLLLCDVQGAELQMLHGAREAIESRALRFLLVSTHHHSISGDPLTHQRCLALLVEAGAHIVAEHSVSESCSGDGLIAAALEPRDADLHVAVSTVRARDSLFGELEYDLAAATARRAPTAIGYARRSEQRDAIAELCEQRGWELGETIVDPGGVRDRDMLGALDAGAVQMLVLADVNEWSGPEDRVALSEIAERQGWGIVCVVTGFEAGVQPGPRAPAEPQEDPFDVLARLTPFAASRGTPTFLFSTADHVVSRDLYAGSAFDEAELAWALDYLGRPQQEAVVVEVGGNIGSTTISLLVRHRARSVVVFEPAPGNVALLRSNLILNGLEERAIVAGVAITDVDGTVELELAPDNFGDHRVRTTPPPDGSPLGEHARQTISVPARTLDGALADSGVAIDDIGLVWVDVQGHEAQVLRGARDLSARPIPWVIEYWPYGLTRVGGLDDLHQMLATTFSEFVDIRQSLVGRGVLRRPLAELPALAPRDAGPDYFTDLILLR